MKMQKISRQKSFPLRADNCVFVCQWCVTGTVRTEGSASLLMSANAKPAGLDRRVTQVQDNLWNLKGSAAPLHFCQDCYAGVHAEHLVTPLDMSLDDTTRRPIKSLQTCDTFRL